MSSLAAAASDLAAHPCPVLCLDTCELLAAVQCLPQGRVDHVDGLRRIIEVLAGPPNRLRIVATELVLHEWSQNVAEAQQHADRFLRALDADNARVHEVWLHLGCPPAAAQSGHAATALVGNLTDLAQAVIDRACVLDRDSTCVDRALRRVLDRQRPSHKGAIKDSLHLEHYLELVRRLRRAGFGERCVFVSGNRSDFWDGQSPHIHPDLKNELDAVGLEFFGHLRSAVGSLGI